MRGRNRFVAIDQRRRRIRRTHRNVSDLEIALPSCSNMFRRRVYLISGRYKLIFARPEGILAGDVVSVLLNLMAGRLRRILRLDRVCKRGVISIRCWDAGMEFHFDFLPASKTPVYK